METIIAIVGSLFAPSMGKWIIPNEGMQESTLKTIIGTGIVVLLITVITNMIRSYRNSQCKKSYGIVSGLKKGGLLAGLSSVSIILARFLPFLILPLMYIPGLKNMANGIFTMISYLIGYFLLATPIFGSC